MYLIPSRFYRRSLNDHKKLNEERFFNNLPGLSRDDTVSRFFTSGPSVDIEENNDEIIVHAEMPGLEKDDFSVDIIEDRLIIKGEKKRKEEKQERKYHWVESSCGTFERNIHLPCEIDPEKATAEYKNGVLLLQLPKIEAHRHKEIKIKFN